MLYLRIPPALAVLLLMTLTLVMAPPASAQTIRSTHYDGNDLIEYSHRPELHHPDVTVEAWIYREGNGCQNILNHASVERSLSFGVCNSGVSFKRADGFPALGTRSVRRRTWTHVAATYDGAAVRFYIDGELDNVFSYPHDLSFDTRGPLYLGAGRLDNGQFFGFFRGHLDEVRIWSEVRTESEIRGAMYEEVRSGEALVAAFGDGGFSDDRSLLGPVRTVSNPEPAVLGILPAALRVPFSPFAELDGEIHLSGEYADAERLVLPFRGLQDDGAAYLVHDEDYLYVGIPASSLAPPAANTYVALFLDPVPGGPSRPSAGEYRFHARLTDRGTSFFEGTGNFRSPHWSAICESGGPWCADHRPQADTRCAGGGDVCTNDDVALEIRVPRSLLGSWEEISGLALAQISVPDGDGGTAHFPAPAQLAGTSFSIVPHRWAPLLATEDSVTFPRVTLEGNVYLGISPATHQSFPAYPVFLRAGGVQIAETNARSDGRFAFSDVAVPRGADLIVGVDNCSGCLLTEPTIAATGVPPRLVGANYVSFPGCDDNTGCPRYRKSNFFLLPDPGPIRLEGATNLEDEPVASGYGGMPVSQEASHDIEGQTVRLQGENLHPLVEVYLARPREFVDPSLWTRYPATVVGFDPDFRFLDVQLPAFEDLSDFPKQNLSWAVRDTWGRIGHRMWTVLDDPLKDFHIKAPPYPLVWGFGWENDEPRSWRSALSPQGFSAVYGENAYRCVGAFGFCAFRVPDPLYWLIYYPIFALARYQLPASCVGMAGGSMLLANGDLETEDFRAGVYYPAGFKELDRKGTYDCGSFLSSPCEPSNPAGLVESNHAKQLSSEMLREFLKDILDAAGGDPLARLAEILQDLDGQMVCMMDEGDITDGHCVVPWKVEHLSSTESRIWIYDNNHPDKEDLYITIDRDANRYDYSHQRSEKHGKGLMTYPRSIWQKSKLSFPAELVLAPLNGLKIMVAGEANVAAVEPAGDSFGTLNVELIRLPSLGNGEEGGRTPELAVVEGDSARLQMAVSGRQAQASASRDGRALALQVVDGTAGVTDEVEITSDAAGRLSSLRYTPQAGHDIISPKLGFRPGEEGDAVTFVWAGLEVPAGASAEFTVLEGERGAAYRNATDLATRHELLVDHVAAADEIADKQLFGPFDVPAGAVHRTTFADWPFGSALVSEIDLDGDGEAESSEIVAGLSCYENPAQDCDDNGVDDRCDLASGTYRDSEGDGVLDRCQDDVLAAPRITELSSSADRLTVALELRYGAITLEVGRGSGDWVVVGTRGSAPASLGQLATFVQETLAALNDPSCAPSSQYPPAERDRLSSYFAQLATLCQG